MASIRKGWRLLAVAGAAALALALVTSAFAQAPPPGPHIFYGSASLDGEAVADGVAVTATNQDGEAVGSSTITNGEWEIIVQSADASSVTFSVPGSEPSMAYAVEQFGMNAVTLDLSSPAGDEPEEPGEPEEPAVEPEEPATEPEEPAPVTPEQPSGLPNTGSGGLADTSGGFPLLPVALAIAALVALGGVAATRRANIGAR